MVEDERQPRVAARGSNQSGDGLRAAGDAPIANIARHSPTSPGAYFFGRQWDTQGRYSLSRPPAHDSRLGCGEDEMRTRVVARGGSVEFQASASDPTATTA